MAPPSGCPPVEVHFEDSCHFIEFETKAKFKPDSQYFLSNTEDWYDDVKKKGDKENLYLMTSIPKVNADGQTATIDGYRSHIFNVYGKTKDNVDTISVYAVSIFDTKDKDNLIKGRKRTRVDGLSKAIEEYEKKGYELAGLSSISSEEASSKYRQFKLSSSHRIQLFECIFQKIGNGKSSSSSSVMYESSVECGITLSGISVKTPKLNTLLQDMAADNYDLTNIVCPPMVLDSDKASSVLPVYLVFKKCKSRRNIVIGRFKHMVHISEYSDDHTVKGDSKEFIKAWADEGWEVRGGINLPGTPKSSAPDAPYKFPILLFFSAEAREDQIRAAS